MNGEEEVIYHNVPSPRPPPPPQQIPSGSAEEEEPPKKKCGFVTKLAIAAVAVFLICMLSIGFSPVGRFTNARKPDSAEGAAELTYAPTYVPTYVPTYAPTYMPTVAATEAVETTVAATEAATTTEAAAVVEDDGNDTTTEAPIDSDLDFSWMGNSTNITDVNVTSTNATTTTTTTTTALICDLKIQYELKSPNATYSFSSKADGTVYFPVEEGEFDGVDEWLYIDQEFESELCVPAGDYELTMSEGVCIGGSLRNNLIFYQCVEGTVTVNID